MTVLLDANAVIMHGRQFPARARAGVEDGRRIVLPDAVKQELVDDVLAGDDPPANHLDSAQTIQTLVDEGVLEVRSPDFERYSTVIDEARRRIADDSLPEHVVQADQYIPALVCELAEGETVDLVTADIKLQQTVREIVTRRGLDESVRIRQPRSVLP